MHMKQRAAALALTGALALSAVTAGIPAQAAEYTDLDWNHWAYNDMMTAVGWDLINGVGGDRMDPSGTMSWEQFLAVAARAFAGDAYNAAVSAGQAWNQAGLTAAQSAGLLEGLSVSADLTGPISRQDAAVLLYNALPEDCTPSRWSDPVDPQTFTDWDAMDPVHQQAVAELARCSVVNGKSDGSFGYADTIQRCDGATLVIRVLTLVDSQHAGETMTVTLRCLNEQTGGVILTQQVQATVGQSLYGLFDSLEVGYYKRDYQASDPDTVSTACSVYDFCYAPMTQAEIEEAQFWEKVDRGEASAEDYMQQDFWLRFQGENQRKCTLLFGDPAKRRFASRTEAEAAMTTVTVPVWKLSNGQKVASTMSFSIHAAIAEDVKQIFTEIYNDPEQFPIRDLGGYSWRGDTATGEHNCGTAIDINANENYQIRDGQVLVGSCWEPGSNPYSIGPDSSVVRIFAEHGWSWGGDAWAGSSDDATGYHDYMHFSYMGE